MRDGASEGILDVAVSMVVCPNGGPERQEAKLKPVVNLGELQKVNAPEVPLEVAVDVAPEVAPDVTPEVALKATGVASLNLKTGGIVVEQPSKVKVFVDGAADAEEGGMESAFSVGGAELTLVLNPLI